MKFQIQKKNYVEISDKNHIALYVTSDYILSNKSCLEVTESIVYVMSTLTILEVKSKDIIRFYEFVAKNTNIIRVELNEAILLLAKNTLKNFKTLDKSIHFMTACHYNCFGII